MVFRPTRRPIKGSRALLTAPNAPRPISEMISYLPNRSTNRAPYARILSNWGEGVAGGVFNGTKRFQGVELERQASAYLTGSHMPGAWLAPLHLLGGKTRDRRLVFSTRVA